MLRMRRSWLHDSALGSPPLDLLFTPSQTVRRRHGSPTKKTACISPQGKNFAGISPQGKLAKTWFVDEVIHPTAVQYGYAPEGAFKAPQAKKGKREGHLGWTQPRPKEDWHPGMAHGKDSHSLESDHLAYKKYQLARMADYNARHPQLTPAQHREAAERAARGKAWEADREERRRQQATPKARPAQAPVAPPLSGKLARRA